MGFSFSEFNEQPADLPVFSDLLVADIFSEPGNSNDLSYSFFFSKAIDRGLIDNVTPSSVEEGAAPLSDD